MKNLSTFDVEELSLKESKETQGGFWLCLLGLVIGVVIGVIFNPEVTPTYTDPMNNF